jgi:hypothetical protein
MKPFLTLLLTTLCAATSYGQTMKALSYNTNGRIIYSGTNELTFTNAVGFAEGDLEITASGGIAWAGELKYEAESQTFFSALAFSSTNVSASTRTNLGLGATWLTNTNAENFRSAIGLGLSALTNTSNVTTMRALSGSTNTNHPFSGSVSVVGTNNTNTLVFSNGILQSVQ